MNSVCITIDVDWAPDFAIAPMAERLLATGVKATWFITHPSPALEMLRRHPDVFELGIHPNFLPGSTHGSTPVEVLGHCLTLVPEAASLRTHALFQSTPLWDLVLESGQLKIDSSLYLPHQEHLRPILYHRGRRALWRVPIFWEDDLEMDRPAPLWDADDLLALGPGLKVFDFHPWHVFLNSSDMAPYQTMKKLFPRLHQADQAVASDHRRSGPGAGSLFHDLTARLSGRGEAITISEAIAEG